VPGLDGSVQGGGRVGARLDASGGEFAGESFGGDRRGAGDEDLSAGGVVGAGDPGQGGALPGPGLPFDDHEPRAAARQRDRLALLI
jgi:hypothetical protein